MARKKESEVVADDLEGTVEGEAQKFFEREKAFYEERTGERVYYEPATPITRTPLPEPVAETQAEEPAEETSDNQGDE